MELKITIKDEKEVVVSAVNNKLHINIGEDAFENNEEWNISSINKFLIKMTASLNTDEKIRINSEESKNLIFIHIVNLFKKFCDEYNK